MTDATASSPAPGNRPLEVRTRGLSWYDWIYTVVTLVMAAILYGSIAWAATTPVAVPLLVVVGAVTAALVLMYLWAENLQGIRRVTVTDRGVTFAYILHKRFAEWRALSMSPFPQPAANRMGGVYISRSMTEQGQPGVWLHFVTRDQARAILTHPSCTIKEIEPGVRAYLGL
jgi:hypothetical protein